MEVIIPNTLGVFLQNSIGYEVSTTNSIIDPRNIHTSPLFESMIDYKLYLVIDCIYEVEAVVVD